MAYERDGNYANAMTKAKDAAKNVANESNPLGFVKRLRAMPVIKQVLRVLDRFL